MLNWNKFCLYAPFAPAEWSDYTSWAYFTPSKAIGLDVKGKGQIFPFQ